MARKILLSIRPWQSRIAYTDRGVLRDLTCQRQAAPSLVGAIFKGRVQRLSKGLNFAFVDIGLERAGFLYGRDAPVQPFSRALREGQEILVQVKNDANREKGARLSMNISLSGKLLVYLPRQENKSAASRKISCPKEKARLIRLIEKLSANENRGALLVRTLSEGQSEKALAADLELLKARWEGVQKQFQAQASLGEIEKAPSPLFTYLRDFPEGLDEIITDNSQTYKETKAFLKAARPSLAPLLKLYKGAAPLFEAERAERQITGLLEKKIPLKSGGSLIIEELEAFAVIDVNSGRFMGKKRAASSVLNLNLEAAKEIARQTRLRHLAGIILVDFVDMEKEEDGAALVSALRAEFANDKNKPRVFPMGELGMVQITRKRAYPSLSDFMSEKCAACGGAGRVKSLDSISAAALFALERAAAPQRSLFARGAAMRLLCHKKIKSRIEKDIPAALSFLKKERGIRAEIVEKRGFSIDRFEIQKAPKKLLFF